MAIIAGITTLDMVRGFSQDKSAVMATGAGAQYRRMINPRHAREVVGVVAILTGIEAVDVNNRLAHGDIAIVTAGTVPSDARMIKYRAREGIGIVTIVTGIAALDMASVFARRNRTIVTARASTLHC